MYFFFVFLPQFYLSSPLYENPPQPAEAMPTSATKKPSEDLIFRLESSENQTKYKSLRELKNQIIGNRTKKNFYVKLGVVIPAVVNSLSSVDSSVVVQACAVIGSFACGIDAGVKAVLDAGAFSILFRLISCPDAKVVSFMIDF